MKDTLISNFKNFFTQRPLTPTVFQFSSNYLSGLTYSLKEGKIKKRLLHTFSRGIIEPSFLKPNIKNQDYIREVIKKSLEKLGSPDGRMALIIPELAQKSFVFYLDSVPSSRRDQEQIILYRIKKQMPSIKENIRISFHVIPGKKGFRIVAAIAHPSIIQEYEDLFRHHSLEVKAVSAPLLSVFNVLNHQKQKMVMNIEDDSMFITII